MFAHPITVHPWRNARPIRAFGAGVAAGAMALTLLLTGVPGATAQTSDPSVSQLQADVDAVNSKYFSALAEYTAADVAVKDNETVVADLKAKAARAKALARERALLAYKSSGAGLAAIVAGSDTARRSQAGPPHRPGEPARPLGLQVVPGHGQGAQGQAGRRCATPALARSSRSPISSSRPPRSTPSSPRPRPGHRQPPRPPSRPNSARPPLRAAAAATTTTPAPKPAPVPPPNYGGTPGTNPHHDDPFLACVRTRESGGNYGAVNPAGPYLGAYQFFQATWNGAAAHAGRMDLVGVPANVATPYDQDEVAWSLYQWQGAGPWGGHCP